MALKPYATPGLLPADNPLSQWVAPRRNALLGLGSGLLSRDMGAIGASTMKGMALDQQYAMDAQALEQEQQTQNATMQWLTQSYPEYAQLGPEQGFQLAMKAEAEKLSAASGAAGSSAPSNVQEWQYYSQLSPEDQTRYLTMKRSNSPLNVGTGFVTQDPANPGATIGTAIPIENRTAAYETGYGGVEGKSDAESAALAESVSSKMPGLRSVIDDLTALADTATYTQLGVAADTMKRELGLPVGQGAIDRSSYIAIVDNQVLPLLRDTFGAAFTQKEGETLRATLGDPNKSPAEKKAILNAFISQKERDIAGMQSRAATGAPGVVPASDYFQ